MRVCAGMSFAVVLMATMAAAQRPDLHAGGAKPSEIPNHVTTKVVLPGFHLGSSTLTVDGACTLSSYTKTENQMTMYVVGNRPVADREGYCNLHVKNASGHADTWIIVDHTDEEQQQSDAADRKAGMEKAAQMLSRAGKEWTVHHSDGTTEHYTFASSPEPAVALFSGPGGKQVKILVGNTNEAVIIGDDGCMLTGTLLQGRVNDGKYYGTCQRTGTWTAEMK